MFFNKYKKIIKNLEEQVNYWENEYKDSLTSRQEINNKNQELKKELEQKENELIQLEKIKQENQIMKKYYKLDEEPSAEVQAKVLVDLRLHDMEYKQLQTRLSNIEQLLWQSTCQILYANTYQGYTFIR